MDFSRIEQLILGRYPNGLPSAELQAKFELAQEMVEFQDEFVRALVDAGIDLGFDLLPMLAQNRFAAEAPSSIIFSHLEVPEKLTFLPQATPLQLAQIGQIIANTIVGYPEIQARFARWAELSASDATEPSSPTYDPDLDEEFSDLISELDDLMVRMETQAQQVVQEQTGESFAYQNTIHCTSTAMNQYVLYVLEHQHLHELIELYQASSGFLDQWLDHQDTIEITFISPDGDFIELSVPPEFAHYHGALLAFDETSDAPATTSAVGETFSPDPAAADKTAEASKAAETPPSTDTTQNKPESEGYQALDPEILSPKPTDSKVLDAEELKNPGYEATPYVEKLSENGGALPASTERFASPREAAERMLSKFVRTHGSIHMIEPSVHVSEFGETLSYWPQVISSSSLPELSFWEAHFGYFSEFPVRMPDGKVEMMDLVELKATLQQFEGANTYFAGTPVVPGVVPMVFSPSFVPAPVASPGFVAPGMGLAPVW